VSACHSLLSAPDEDDDEDDDSTPFGIFYDDDSAHYGMFYDDDSDSGDSATQRDAADTTSSGSNGRISSFLRTGVLLAGLPCFVSLATFVVGKVSPPPRRTRVVFSVWSRGE